MPGFVTFNGKIEIERVAIDILDSLKPVMEELNLTENSLANSLHKIILQYNFTIKVHSVQATSWGSYGTLIRLTINSTIYEQYCITYIIHYLMEIKLST